MTPETEVRALIERLRSPLYWVGNDKPSLKNPDGPAAAATLEALLAERERMREALKKIADPKQNDSFAGDPMKWPCTIARKAQAMTDTVPVTQEDREAASWEITIPGRDGDKLREHLSLAFARHRIEAELRGIKLGSDLIQELSDHLDGVTGARSRPDSDSGELVARADAFLRALDAATYPPAYQAEATRSP